VCLLLASGRAVGAPVLRVSGTVVTGGQAGSFSQTIDLKNGNSLLVQDTGSLRDVSGFDGAGWDFQNGILTTIDLPSLVMDARTQAYLDRFGWRDGARGGADSARVTPPGGSPVTLWFDAKTHQVQRAVAETDGGPLTTVFADWRDVSGVQVPFRKVQTDPIGGVTEMDIKTASVSATGDDAALQRPAPAPHGTLTAGAPNTVKFAFTSFDHGHIAVPASLNGTPATLLFDSGGANYLPPATARRLGLTISGGLNIGGVGETGTTGGFARLASVSIGAASLHDEVAIVGPLPYAVLHPRKDLTTDGLAGFEFLSEFRVTIDYAARTMTLARFTDPPPRGVTVPFFSDGHSIYVPASVNGATGLFRVDTGDGGTVTVFGNFARAHHLFEGEGTAVVAAGGVGGTLGTRKIHMRHFVLAGQDFTDLPGDVVDAKLGGFASRALAGNLGAGVFRRFAVSFDYHAHSVTFAPYRVAPAPVAENRSGLSINQNGPDAIDILSVTPGSPAAAAGLRAGDAITVVNGVSVRDGHFGVFDLARLVIGSVPFSVTTARAGVTRVAVGGGQVKAH